MEQFGEAIVTNSYLKIAVVVLSLVILGLVFLDVRTLNTFHDFKPLVIRIDELGRAQAVGYDTFAYKPEDKEAKYFLTQFCELYYRRNRYTVNDDFTKSFYFLDGKLANDIMAAYKNEKVIEDFLSNPSSPEVDIDVQQVALEPMLKPPYKASVDFYMIQYSPVDHSVLKKTLYTATFVFMFRTNVENLPNLPLALAESRKSNTRMVLGLQGRSHVEMRYGREAEAMLSQPRTKIFLRTSEPRAAEWISKCIGDVEIEHLREGRTSGEFGFHQSKNASVDNRIQTAILASEISNLENLNGYFQTPGFTLKLRFPYLAAAKTLPPFIQGTVPEVALPAIPPAPSPTEQLTLNVKPVEIGPTDVGRRGRKRKRSGKDTAESRPMMQVD
jgi:type IV secretion system protein VirB5